MSDYSKELRFYKPGPNANPTIRILPPLNSPVVGFLAYGPTGRPCPFPGLEKLPPRVGVRVIDKETGEEKFWLMSPEQHKKLEERLGTKIPIHGPFFAGRSEGGR